MTEETYTHAGFTVEIGMEEDSSFADPRDNDNLSAMVCWHPDYILGDEQLTTEEGRGAYKRDHHGSASTLFTTEHGRTDFRDMRVVERYLRFARGAVVTMPLYLLDHSGISMSVGAPSMGDTPKGGVDHHGNARMWDTTMVGYVYTTAERIEELCGGPRNGDEFYCPDDWKGTAREWIVEQLRNDVREYDAWLRGSVYWYAVKDAAGETVESCGGYIVATEEDMKYLRSEAEGEAEAHAEARNAERRRKAGDGFRRLDRVVLP